MPEFPEPLDDRCRQQAQYEAVYEAWLAEMPPEEAEKVRAMGLQHPESNITQINGKGRSADDLKFIKDRGPITSHDTERSCALVSVLQRMWDAKSPRVILAAYMAEFGLFDVSGWSCQRFSDELGVSRQYFCKVRTNIRDTHDIPPPLTGKTAAQRLKQSQQVRGKSKPKKLSTGHVWTKYAGPVDNLKRWIHNRERECPPSQWPAAARETLLRELTPVVQWWVRAGGDLEAIEA